MQAVNHDGVLVCPVMPVAQVRMIGRKVGVVMDQFRRIECGPKPENGGHCHRPHCRQSNGGLRHPEG